MIKKNCDILLGSLPRPNANDGGLQPLWVALSGQSASPKLDVVFFSNCRQNAERIAPLHRQTKHCSIANHTFKSDFTIIDRCKRDDIAT